ncbi:MAG TPA: MBL fold metallo-hydrolase [bacterium]|nr:MBL fold metallo-hydrolase [bacterium]
MITNAAAGTRVDEIREGLYRISTPMALPNGGGFTMNQFLIVDDEPLLWHTGPRLMFDFTREAIAAVMPVERLRHIGFSHVEADECGALNQFLAMAPNAAPLCGQVAAMVSVGDMADRPPRALADGDELSLGRRTVRWLDTPHLPHNWESGYLFETSTRTLLCGDILTQPGGDHPPLTSGDIIGPSEGMRAAMRYFAPNAETPGQFDKLIATDPLVLACMHGASWEGDAAALLTRYKTILCPA